MADAGNRTTACPRRTATRRISAVARESDHCESKLFELIEGENLVVYRDAGIRLAISRAIALETPRGWRIAKEKQAHKIDVVVALAMAAYAAVKGQSESSYCTDYSRWVG